MVIAIARRGERFRGQDGGCDGMLRRVSFGAQRLVKVSDAAREKRRSSPEQPRAGAAETWLAQRVGPAFQPQRCGVSSRARNAKESKPWLTV
jgi:hypothetical protein